MTDQSPCPVVYAMKRTEEGHRFLGPLTEGSYSVRDNWPAAQRAKTPPLEPGLDPVVSKRSVVECPYCREMLWECGAWGFSLYRAAQVLEESEDEVVFIGFHVPYSHETLVCNPCRQVFTQPSGGSEGAAGYYEPIAEPRRRTHYDLAMKFALESFARRRQG